MNPYLACKNWRGSKGRVQVIANPSHWQCWGQRWPQYRSSSWAGHWYTPSHTCFGCTHWPLPCTHRNTQLTFNDRHRLWKLKLNNHHHHYYYYYYYYTDTLHHTHALGVHTDHCPVHTRGGRILGTLRYILENSVTCLLPLLLLLPPLLLLLTRHR